IVNADGCKRTPFPPAKLSDPPATPPVSNAAPIWREEFIEAQPAEACVHVSSLCELPGGQLAAAWYAGTREGARDVVIQFATRSADPTGGWSRPQPVVTRATAAA